MKKCLLLIIWVIALFSCTSNSGNKINEKNKPLCLSSFEEAYEKFSESVSSREFDVLERMSGVEMSYDSILGKYKTLSIQLIPKSKDGAYGIFHRGESNIYYLFISDNDILVDARVLELKSTGGCFKVWNFVKFPIDDKLKEVFEASKDDISTKEENPTEFRRITTIADGFDVKRVNLFDSTDGSSRKMIGYCINNEEVGVVDRMDGYVYVQKKDGVRGWCLEEFLQ